MIPHSVVEHSLAELEESGFILCNNAKRTLFTFKDATMRSVIYKTIIESTWKSLNTAIINYFEEKYKEGKFAQSVGHSPTAAARSPPAPKQVRSPVWQAAPT